jgi:ATPase subunit of ABC transporter with duplicated ATPase domains
MAALREITDKTRKEVNVAELDDFVTNMCMEVERMEAGVLLAQDDEVAGIACAPVMAPAGAMFPNGKLAADCARAAASITEKKGKTRTERQAEVHELALERLQAMTDEARDADEASDVVGPRGETSEQGLEQLNAEAMVVGLTPGQRAVLTAYMDAVAARGDASAMFENSAYLGANVKKPVRFLLHGPPGTGKSHLVKVIASTLAAQGQPSPTILAPTGVAAVASGGLTAHYFLKLKKSCNFAIALEMLKKQASARAQLLAKCEGSTLARCC